MGDDNRSELQSLRGRLDFLEAAVVIALHVAHGGSIGRLTSLRQSVTDAIQRYPRGGPYGDGWIAGAESMVEHLDTLIERKSPEKQEKQHAVSGG